MSDYSYDMFVADVAALALYRGGFHGELQFQRRGPLFQVRFPEQEGVKRSHEFRIFYSYGDSENLRGVTRFGVWSSDGEKSGEVVEVFGAAQECLLQVAGTTIHEVAHVLAGLAAGHGKSWKGECEKLGLTGGVKAVGTVYAPEMFDRKILKAIQALPAPVEGGPVKRGRSVQAPFYAVVPGFQPGPCRSSRGAKGGKSSGRGSGSRMLKCVCQSCGYTARITKTWLDKGEPECACKNGNLSPV